MKKINKKLLKSSSLVFGFATLSTAVALPLALNNKSNVSQIVETKNNIIKKERQQAEEVVEQVKKSFNFNDEQYNDFNNSPVNLEPWKQLVFKNGFLNIKSDGRVFTKGLESYCIMDALFTPIDNETGVISEPQKIEINLTIDTTKNVQGKEGIINNQAINNFPISEIHFSGAYCDYDSNKAYLIVEYGGKKSSGDFNGIKNAWFPFIIPLSINESNEIMINNKVNDISNIQTGIKTSSNRVRTNCIKEVSFQSVEGDLGKNNPIESYYSILDAKLDSEEKLIPNEYIISKFINLSGINQSTKINENTINGNVFLDESYMFTKLDTNNLSSEIFNKESRFHFIKTGEKRTIYSMGNYTSAFTVNSNKIIFYPQLTWSSTLSDASNKSSIISSAPIFTKASDGSAQSSLIMLRNDAENNTWLSVAKMASDSQSDTTASQQNSSDKFIANIKLDQNLSTPSELLDIQSNPRIQVSKMDNWENKGTFSDELSAYNEFANINYYHDISNQNKFNLNTILFLNNNGEKHDIKVLNPNYLYLNFQDKVNSFALDNKKQRFYIEYVNSANKHTLINIDSTAITSPNFSDKTLTSSSDNGVVDLSGDSSTNTFSHNLDEYIEQNKNIEGKEIEATPIKTNLKSKIFNGTYSANSENPFYYFSDDKSLNLVETTISVDPVSAIDLGFNADELIKNITSENIKDKIFSNKKINIQNIVTSNSDFNSSLDYETVYNNVLSSLKEKTTIVANSYNNGSVNCTMTISADAIDIFNKSFVSASKNQEITIDFKITGFNWNTTHVETIEYSALGFEAGDACSNWDVNDWLNSDNATDILTTKIGSLKDKIFTNLPNGANISSISISANGDSNNSIKVTINLDKVYVNGEEKNEYKKFTLIIQNIPTKSTELLIKEIKFGDENWIKIWQPNNKGFFVDWKNDASNTNINTLITHINANKETYFNNLPTNAEITLDEELVPEFNENDCSVKVNIKFKGYEDSTEKDKKESITIKLKQSPNNNQTIIDKINESALQGKDTIESESNELKDAIAEAINSFADELPDTFNNITADNITINATLGPDNKVDLVITVSKGNDKLEFNINDIEVKLTTVNNISASTSNYFKDKQINLSNLIQSKEGEELYDELVKFVKESKDTIFTNLPQDSEIVEIISIQKDSLNSIKLKVKVNKSYNGTNTNEKEFDLIITDFKLSETTIKDENLVISIPPKFDVDNKEQIDGLVDEILSQFDNLPENAKIDNIDEIIESIKNNKTDVTIKISPTVGSDGNINETPIEFKANINFSNDQNPENAIEKEDKYWWIPLVASVGGFIVILIIWILVFGVFKSKKSKFQNY